MDKTAVITGSARGIGAAIALQLAKDGYNIALNDISENSFDDNTIINDIESLNVKCKYYICDVSDFSQCENFVKQVKEDFGSVDCLVNNAGITSDSLLMRMSEENYDRVISVNQKSVFNMTKSVSAIMVKQRSGCIVNITSVAGIYGNPGQFNYSASKGAIIAMTKTTAKEFGSRNIRANAVAPGFIQTPMTDKLTDDQKKRMLEQVSLKRYGTPQEVAAAVSFLASDNAAYITGQILEVSGGLMM